MTPSKLIMGVRFPPPAFSTLFVLSSLYFLG
jgi:hypothetical protein